VGVPLFPRENDFDDLFTQAVHGHAWPDGWNAWALAKAVAAEESGFNPAAYHFDPNVNDASRGIMQIEGATAAALHLSPADDATRTGGPYDPEEGIPAGVGLLAANIQKAGGDVAIAVAAYNSGWSTLRPGDAPRDAAGNLVSANYVDRVLNHFYPYYVQQAQPRGVV